MVFVVFLLYRTAAFRFPDGGFHRRGHGIGVHYHFALRVSRRSAYYLYQRAFVSQKALFVRVKNSDKRNFGQVKTLAEQVYPDKDVKLSQTQVAERLYTFESFRFMVHIPNA